MLDEQGEFWFWFGEQVPEFLANPPRAGVGVGLGKTGLKAWAHPGGCWLPLWPKRALGARPAPHLGRWDPSRRLQGALQQPTSPGRGRGAPGGEGPGVCPRGACALWCRAEDSGSRDGTVASMDSPRVEWGEQQRGGRGPCVVGWEPPSAEERRARLGVRLRLRNHPLQGGQGGKRGPAGWGAPRLRTAGAGRGPWSPAPAEGARPWCPFR